MDDAARTVVVAHPSPDLYGSDRVLLESVGGLVAAGHRVVVALPSDGPLAGALRERGAVVEYVGSPVLRKSSLSPLGLVRLAADALRSLPPMLRLIRAERAALVLVNTITIPLWLAAGRLAGVPVACHVHEAEKSIRPALRRVLYLPLLLARVLVVNSRFSLDVLSEAWPLLRRRGRLLYNGVPGPAEPVPARTRLDSPVELLFIGRLSPRKGPQVALEALRRLEAAEPGRYRLTLLGAVFEGYEWFEAELRATVAEAGLGHAVVFAGFDPDVWGYFARTDIVLVPSTVDEPFGNTAVEAMLALRPLVVSDTSGLKEAAGGYRTARLVPPGDPAALAAAVTGLAGDWTRVVADSASDRELARSRHDPPVYQAGMAGLVAEAIGSPTAGHGRRGFGDELRAAMASAEDTGRVGLVVVNYGSSALLERNVAAAMPGVQVVVVDSFSTTAEREAIARLAGERGWELVAPDQNPGFGEGVNLGVLRAAALGCRVFVTLNPDAVADPGVVAGLGQCVREDPRALVSPLVLRPDGRPFFRGSTIDMRTGRIRTGWVDGDDDPDWKNWLSGACLAFGGEAFAALDGFADGYFLYWEDVDLSRRAAALGLRLMLREDLTVTHDEGGTHTERGAEGKSSLYYWYNTRNRLLFGARLAGRADRARWLLSTPRESLRIWLRGGRRQLLVRPQGLLAAVGGSVAGVAAWAGTRVPPAGRQKGS
ncbi:MAG: glycosyltransferase [Actinobacteria bacterium]|nr:glycosyltransferase [Actinomycetota bacterium]